MKINFNTKKISDNKEFLLFLNGLSKRNCCFMCKYTFENKLLKKQPYKITRVLNMFNPEFISHLYLTHGISPDDFNLMLQKKIK